MVEGAALEMRCTSNRTEGSNPSLSAFENPTHLGSDFLMRRGGSQLLGFREGFERLGDVGATCCDDREPRPVVLIRIQALAKYYD